MYVCAFTDIVRMETTTTNWQSKLTKVKVSYFIWVYIYIHKPGHICMSVFMNIHGQSVGQSMTCLSTCVFFAGWFGGLRIASPCGGYTRVHGRPLHGMDVWNTYILTCIHIYTYMHIHICTYTHTCICTWTCIHTCMSKYTYTCMDGGVGALPSTSGNGRMFVLKVFFLFPSLCRSSKVRPPFCQSWH